MILDEKQKGYLGILSDPRWRSAYSDYFHTYQDYLDFAEIASKITSDTVEYLIANSYFTLKSETYDKAAMPYYIAAPHILMRLYICHMHEDRIRALHNKAWWTLYDTNRCWDEDNWNNSPPWPILDIRGLDFQSEKWDYEQIKKAGGGDKEWMRYILYYKKRRIRCDGAALELKDPAYILQAYHLTDENGKPWFDWYCRSDLLENIQDQKLLCEMAASLKYRDGDAEKLIKRVTDEDLLFQFVYGLNNGDLLDGEDLEALERWRQDYPNAPYTGVKYSSRNWCINSAIERLTNQEHIQAIAMQCLSGQPHMVQVCGYALAMMADEKLRDEIVAQYEGDPDKLKWHMEWHLEHR